MLALGFSYIVFIMLRNIPSSPSFFRAFTMKVGFCQRLFLCLLRDSYGFCPCICLCTVLCLLIYVCWAILASLEWNQLGNDVWSFWCVIEFCLLVFCWKSLHLYSLKILVYNSFFLCLYWFWNECNDGFIEWVW
jgi:hypothetical protein